MNNLRTLNQYVGSDPQGNTVTIVAEDMETACRVYKTQQDVYPTQMMQTKQNIACVLPEDIVTFTAQVFCATATPVGCTVTPGTYTLVAGTKQVFTAVEGEGFTFSKWLINGEDVTDEEGQLITDKVALLTIPAGKPLCTFTAVFMPVTE